MGSSHSKSKSPAGKGGARGPNKPTNNQPNKNNKGGAGGGEGVANDKAGFEVDKNGPDGKLDLPEDKNQNLIKQSTMADHRLDGEASPTLVLNKQ